MKNIVLIGPSGVGKTTVGKYMSNELKVEQVDTDILIEKHFNMSIQSIFEKYGENWFRKKEHSIVKKISNKRGAVISTGGGIVLNKENIKKLKLNGILFLLMGSIDTILHNLAMSKERRPLIGNDDIQNKVEKLFFERKKLYIGAADYIINIDNKGIEEIGDEIIYLYKKY